MSKNRSVAAALLGICVALILWITILNRGQVEVNYSPPFQSLVSFWKDIQRNGIRGNILGNIILFMPIGFLVPLVLAWSRKWYRTILIGFGFSLLIETIQLISARGCFEVDDLILNSLGTAIGWGIITFIHTIDHSKRIFGDQAV